MHIFNKHCFSFKKNTHHHQLVVAYRKNAKQSKSFHDIKIWERYCKIKNIKSCMLLRKKKMKV